MIPHISKRELQVLNLISHAYSSVEISEMLFLSPETIKSHRKSLMNKLSAKNAAGLVRKGFEYKLLQRTEMSSLSIAS